MKFMYIATAAAAVALLGPIGASAATVSVFPAVQAVGQGATAKVTVGISGLNSGDEIASAFDLLISYTDSHLTFSGAKFLAGIEFGALSADPPCDATSTTNCSFDTLGSTLGNVNAVGYSLADDATLQGLQGDGFNLFELSFTTKNVDVATYLSFGSNPPYSPYVTGLNFSPLGLQFVGACIAIGSGTCTTTPPVNVPEPASHGLAAVALLAAGLAGSKWRRKATPAVDS